MATRNSHSDMHDISLTGSSDVHLWTFQSNNAYNVLQREGVLLALAGHENEELAKFYEWMRRAYGEHTAIDPLPSSLLWGYGSYGMVTSSWESGSVDGDWLLSVRIPANRVLFSDYMQWHIPLNNGYGTRATEHTDACWGDDPPFCEACARDDAFCALADVTPRWRDDYRKLPPYLRTELERSWVECTFEFTDDSPIQAVFDRVRMPEVLRVCKVSSTLPPPPPDAPDVSPSRAVDLNNAVSSSTDSRLIR